MNANRVNLLYWHLSPYVYDRLCDNEWVGPERHLTKHVINAAWYNWATDKNLEIWHDMNHLALDDMYVYIVYTNMTPKDETFWRLKYEVLHKKDMEP